MKTVYHPAESRGFADHGWLRSSHTFSFANYYNRERMHFGALRVINDDCVKGGEGFGTHPHSDMEIISLPLEGALQHRDSMGNGSIIRRGDVQVMSAGSGITHSEFNADPDQPVKFLQIWVFPREKGGTPRYGQVRIADFTRRNDFQQIVSPNPEDEGVWIHQDAWFHLADFDKGTVKTYEVKKTGNGVYLFVISGRAKVGLQILDRRDGYGIWDTGGFTLEVLEDSEVLVIDVPMELP